MNSTSSINSFRFLSQVIIMRQLNIWQSHKMKLILESSLKSKNRILWRYFKSICKFQNPQGITASCRDVSGGRKFLASKDKNIFLPWSTYRKGNTSPHQPLPSNCLIFMKISISSFYFHSTLLLSRQRVFLKIFLAWFDRSINSSITPIKASQRPRRRRE